MKNDARLRYLYSRAVVTKTARWLVGLTNNMYVFLNAYFENVPFAQFLPKNE